MDEGHHHSTLLRLFLGDSRIALLLLLIGETGASEMQSTLAGIILFPCSAPVQKRRAEKEALTVERTHTDVTCEK